MKKLGLTLIWLSFLAAALVAVQEARVVNWSFYVPLLIVGLIGIGVVRAGHRQQVQHVDRVAANIGTLHKSLENVVKNTTKLNAEKASIHVYDMRHKIDELLLQDLDDFAEAREAIGHKYGLQNYADVMSHFAAGERYLNRVWSCSADGYIDEASDYIEKAEVELKEAFRLLQQLESSAPT